MNELTSELTIIPEAGDDLADRPVLRTEMGVAGPDWNGQQVSVVVDVDIDDGNPYVAVLVEGHGMARKGGVGDDAVVELLRSDYVRALAAKLLEAADVMDATTGNVSA